MEDVMRLMYRLVAGCALLTTAASASAAVVDPAGDLLATYTGPVSGDIDITRGMSLRRHFLSLHCHSGGQHRRDSGATYAWGINRGAGTARIDLLRIPISPPISCLMQSS
jgi:hypothetical protein